MIFKNISVTITIGKQEQAEGGAVFSFRSPPQLVLYSVKFGAKKQRTFFDSLFRCAAVGGGYSVFFFERFSLGND